MRSCAPEAELLPIKWTVKTNLRLRKLIDKSALAENLVSSNKRRYGKLDGIRRRLTTGYTVHIEKL